MKEKEPNPKIAVIGAGLSGICVGTQLQSQLGIFDYVMFDENHDFGGVWLVNTYPGCACDIPSQYYSFSFEPNPYWSELFASQAEIREYIASVANKHGLESKTKFGHRVVRQTWDEKVSKWKLIVRNAKGIENEHCFDIVIICTGGLRVPNNPEEFDSFQGPKMHSAKWNPDIKLAKKKVAVVGTGASAVQIIPQIADEVEALKIFQRNPPWVIPRFQFSFPQWFQWIFASVPGIQKLLRYFLFWMYEFSHNIYTRDSAVSRLVQRLAKSYVTKEFKKKEGESSVQQLIPKYRPGCKRITPSDEYYKTLSRPNVKIVASKIKEVKAHAILTENGDEEDVDVLILATGFKVQDYFAPMEVIGKDGIDVLKLWKNEGPSAYLGMMTHILPNCFFIIGPNAAPGYTSAIFAIECEVNWIIQVIRKMMQTSSSYVTVDEDVEKQFMAEIQKELKKTVWHDDCGAWYKDNRGVVTAVSPDSAVQCWKRTRCTDFSHLIFE